MEDRCRECGKPLRLPRDDHDERQAMQNTSVCSFCRDKLAEQVREAKRAWYEQ